MHAVLNMWCLSLFEFQKNRPVGQNESDSDDDIPQLSAHTLEALQEFYTKEQQRLETEASQENKDIDEDWVC